MKCNACLCYLSHLYMYIYCSGIVFQSFTCMNFMMSISFAPNSLFTIVGGTGSGKSHWVFKFLRNLPYMFGDTPTKRVMYCYGIYQSLFDEIKRVKMLRQLLTGHLSYIYLLGETKSAAQRKALLSTITKEQFKVLTLILYNIVHLKIPIESIDQKKLKRYRRPLSVITDKKIGARQLSRRIQWLLRYW